MGSYGVDVEIRFDTADAMRKAKEFSAKYNALAKESSEKAQKYAEDYARTVVTSGTRAGRQMEQSIKAVERQAQMVGKLYS
jgi:hypothetical protein